jgi:lipopolysaccharide transport system permease protein
MPSASSSLPIRVIVPHSGLAGIRFAVASIFSGFRQARQLAWRFFLRDTRAAHRQSILGYFWMILPPLANTLVWVFLNKSDVIRIDSGSTPYPLFVLAGTILWGAFNGGLMASMGVVGEARGVLSKVNFPHESLIYTAFLKSLLDSLIPALLILPALLIYGVGFHTSTLGFLVALLAALSLGLGIGILLIPIAALYSDVSRAIQLALRFGFFVTPVIFPLPQGGLSRTLFCLNPITPIIVSGRAWLVGSGETMNTAFFLVIAAVLLLSLFGMILFKVAMPHLIERLSS